MGLRAMIYIDLPHIIIHTDMNTLTGPQIQRMIDDLRRVVASCEPLTSKTKVPQLDADILRSQLQGIYEQLFFAQQADEKHTVEKPCIQPAEPDIILPKPVAAPIVPPIIAAPDAVITAPSEKTTVEKPCIPAPEQVAAPPKPAPVPEPVVEAAAPDPAAPPIAAMHEIPVSAPTEKPTVENLYIQPAGPVADPQKTATIAATVSTPAPEPRPAPAPVAQPKPEPAKPAPAPQFQAPAPTTRFQQKPITNISAAIGLNDRFLYIRTLFGGNASELADTVAKLNAMSNFDDAMHYLTTRYQWDMEDAVTIQFLELVNRRFI